MLKSVLLIGLWMCLLGMLLSKAGRTSPWLPPSEPSPFLPDGARWIGRAEEGHMLYARRVFTLAKPVRRAVLMAAPGQLLAVYLNGRLTGTAYRDLDAEPLVVEVGARLRQGANMLAARIWSAWRPGFYAQLRVEYRDGSWEDIATDGRWECASEVEPGWESKPDLGGKWQKAEERGGYVESPGEGLWGHRFALMARPQVRDYFGAHNRSLRRLWLQDRKGPFSRFQGSYLKPEYAARYRDFLRLDRETGRLIAPDGRPLYLFFTIYVQRRGDGVVMGIPELDFDRLERDLDLMEEAHVNLYIRNCGWNWLLDGEGRWMQVKEQPKGSHLPRFEYVYQIYDYFLDRAQAHGLYVIFEGDFYWSAHSVVPPPYRTRYYLYPEALEAEAYATRKIMNYFSERTCLLGMMIGEEDIIMEYDLTNPHLHRGFTGYLRRTYKTLESLKRAWTHGYDYADSSQWQRVRRRPEYGPDQVEEVLAPRYPYRPGVFEPLTGWEQIPLPLWPPYRAPEAPEVPLLSHRSYNDFTPYDPLWIAYHTYREDELLFQMLCRWAWIVREGCPRQLLFYSNAQDFTNSWHFLHFQRRAEIPFDVVGVGCHDSGLDLQDIAPWERIRKYYKVVASYRPLVRTPGSLPKGIASGEGEGGKAEHPEEVLNYYRGAIFDERGGGVAWTQTYNWLHISGSDSPAQAPHKTPLLAWMSRFMPEAERVPFPLHRAVPLLIVRNQNLQRSNRSGLDYGNAQGLAGFLAQLNIEFDIVKDRHLTYRSHKRFKVDLDPYRILFLPTVSMDYPDSVWQALDAWLSDPSHAGKRALCIGLIEKRTPALAPREMFHPMLRRWLGVADYTGQRVLKGSQTLTLTRPLGRMSSGQPLHLNFGDPGFPTGILSGGEPLLKAADGSTVGAVYSYGGSRIYVFGFPLGLAYNELWGIEIRQPSYDAITPLWEGIVEATGVPRPIRAPHHVRVYVSDRAEMILVREWFGIGGDIAFDSQVPAGLRFEGVSTERLPDGYTRFRLSLPAWGGLYWRGKSDEERVIQHSAPARSLPRAMPPRRSGRS